MIDVLLTDDHPVVLKGLRQAISETMDIAVAGEVRSGDEALRFLRDSPPDVLVLDLAMPGMGGLEVLHAVRTEVPGLPDLILSMHSEDQYAVRMLQAGAAGYLTKAEAPRKIVEAIRQVSAGQKYISPYVAQELAIHAESQELNRQPHERLTGREFQIMLQLAQGRSIREIADALSLSQSTVRTHRRHILEKMGLKNEVELALYVERTGLSGS